MLVSQWAILAAMAFALTIVWAFGSPSTNVYVSAGLATISWSAAALTAPGLTVVSGGERLSATAPTLAFVSLSFAALSALAVLGYRTGHYPPEPSSTEPIPSDD